MLPIKRNSLEMHNKLKTVVCIYYQYYFSQEVGFKCDGVADCGDHSDEIGCNVCPDDHWLCPLSAENGGQPVCVPNQDRFLSIC